MVWQYVYDVQQRRHSTDCRDMDLVGDSQHSVAAPYLVSTPNDYIYAVVEDGFGMPGASTENEASIHMHGHFERILRISAQKSLQASHER